MTSALKNAVANAAGTLSSPLETGAGGEVDVKETAKYLLLVTAGPSYDASIHGPVHVNGESYNVSNEHMTASINVRIRDYHGLPNRSPRTHDYFSCQRHKHDRYSVSFSFMPKKDIPGDELIMGYDFDRPIRDRLPPLFKPALKLMTTVIDPGIYCDAYADKPYVYGPALSSFPCLSIGDKLDGASGSPPASTNHPPSRVVEEGAEGTGVQLRKDMGIPENSDKRRKHFLKEQNLNSFTWEAGREYEADFFNPFIDFTNFALCLPGITINVSKYIDEKTHTLRYVLKNRKNEEVYFVVVFTLLSGQDLKDALKEERRRLGEPEPAEASARSSEENGTNEASDSSKASCSQTPVQREGVLSSLGKWLPKMLRSGGTVSAATTSSPNRKASLNQCS